VILVTGVTRESGMAFDRGNPEERPWSKADTVLHKPVRLEDLRREIARLLAR
jgi:hypothetical protein